MAAQQEKMDFTNKATLTPVLHDAQDKTIAWASAQNYLSAVATWTHAGVDGFGTFTINAAGVATFVPTAEGTGVVELKVDYVGTDGTPGSFTQDLEIEVIKVFTPTGIEFNTTVTPQ
jgi:hypothetical protein